MAPKISPFPSGPSETPGVSKKITNKTDEILFKTQTKDLNDVKKMTVFLVYILIRAFYPEIFWFRIYDFFLFLFTNKIEPNLTKCLKWVTS